MKEGRQAGHIAQQPTLNLPHRNTEEEGIVLGLTREPGCDELRWTSVLIQVGQEQEGASLGRIVKGASFLLQISIAAPAVNGADFISDGAIRERAAEQGFAQRIFDRHAYRNRTLHLNKPS
jgi:hypothetical protein